MKHLISFTFSLVAVLTLATTTSAQVTTGSLSGNVQNEAQASVSVWPPT